MEETSKELTRVENGNSLLPAQKEGDYLKEIMAIEKIVRASMAFYTQTRIRPTTEFEVGPIFGTTYDNGFVQRVANGDLSMAEILKTGDTPLVNPKRWLNGDNKGIGIISAVVPTYIEDILNLKYERLCELQRLQEEESRIRTGGPKSWGLIRLVRLGEYKHGVTEFSIETATSVQNLFLQASFEGSRKTNKGSVGLKLLILPYADYRIDGFAEWYHELPEEGFGK